MFNASVQEGAFGSVVAVGIGVLVAVAVGDGVLVAVAVAVGVLVAVAVAVAVGVLVAVGAILNGQFGSVSPFLGVVNKVACCEAEFKNVPSANSSQEVPSTLAQKRYLAIRPFSPICRGRYWK